MIYKRYIYAITGIITKFVPYNYKRTIYVSISLIFFFIFLDHLSSMFYNHHLVFSYMSQSINLVKSILYTYPIIFISQYIQSDILVHIIYMLIIAFLIFILKINSKDTRLSLILILIILILYRFK